MRKVRGQVIATTSMKGGVGKTETSLNIAVAIRKLTGKRVIVVDFDIPYGGVAQALALKKESSISDWIRTNRIVSEEAVKKLVLSHSSGIDILPAIASANDLERFTTEVAERILHQLTTIYDYVVIDSGVDLGPTTRLALTAADFVVIVTTPHNASIWNNHQYKEDLVRMGVHPGKMILFINKVSPSQDIEMKDIIHVFKNAGVPIQKIFSANDEDQIRRLRNFRDFVYIKQPHSTFSKAINEILGHIGVAPSPITHAKSSSFWDALRRLLG